MKKQRMPLAMSPKGLGNDQKPQAVLRRPAAQAQGKPSVVSAQAEGRHGTIAPDRLDRAAKLGHSMGRLFEGTLAQRALATWEDEDIKALANYHPLGKEKDDAGTELSDEDLGKIKEGVQPLTGFYGAVDCNCFGWALGIDQNLGDKGTIYNWKKDHGGADNFVDPGSGEANIILWGTKKGEGEDTWDVTHASVLLTHAELLARSGKFKGLKVTKKDLEGSSLPDPFWSSAGGFG